MMLLVKQGRTATYGGKTYKAGETFDVDLAGHNARAHVKALKAVGKCEDAPLGSPIGEVAGVRQAEPDAQLFPAHEPTAVEPDVVEPGPAAAAEAKAEAEPAATETAAPPARAARGGRYNRRDLRAQD